MFNNLRLKHGGNEFSSLNGKSNIPSIFESFAYTDENPDMSEMNTFKSSLTMSKQLTVEEKMHIKDSTIASGIDLAWMVE